MIYRLTLIVFTSFLAAAQLFAQADKSAYSFTGIVYDEHFIPLPYTHVIASGTGQGDMTDSLGIFTLYIRESDMLSFFNITCHDTVVSIKKDQSVFFIKLKRKIYPLLEAKIFVWGSSYGDFMNEVNRQGAAESLGVKMGLPTQAPGVIPFDLDEKKIKSEKFFFKSPVSYLYYNFSKLEQGRRKAYTLQQDADLIQIFEETLSTENISEITELTGEELELFMVYLNSHLKCTYHCGEIELLTEIFAIWEGYGGGGQ